MEFLAEIWILWLFLAIISLVLMMIYRQGRGVDTEMISSPDEFSIKTVLFGLRKGEGDLFIGHLLALFFFSLFLAGIIRWVSSFL